MSVKNSARAELEDSVRKLLAKIPGSGRHQAADEKDRPVNLLENPAEVEKTIHDLRASLNVVIGFTELMLDETMGKINKDQRRGLTDILDNSRLLLGLSDDIIRRLEALTRDKK